MASLYLHIPFCEHKCIYCDFYSLAPSTGRQEYDALVRRFLVALETELSLRAADPAFAVPFETVFFGGGTPSLLGAGDIRGILEQIRAGFPLSPGAEITLEANPGTVDRAALEAIRSAGVNRLSIGIQSFHQDDLAFLTRIHSADQARACVRNAFRAGFDNVSLDLIFSLPGQTPERWRWNLEEAVKLHPTHISCYSLIVEPRTPLDGMVRRGAVRLLHPDVDAELYELTIRFLAEHGYEQYEISNFALPGFRSRHNSNYWNHANYLGFGPSAHSFWNGRRWWNGANMNTYTARLEARTFPVDGEEILSEEQLFEERVFLGLRSEGIDTEEIGNRFRRNLVPEKSPVVGDLVARNLATFDGRMLRLTPGGYAVCDEICRQILG